MTISQQTRDALTRNWESAKQHLRTAFPNVTDEDLNANDPDAFMEAYAQRMGGDRSQIERQLDQVAQTQYGSQPNQPQGASQTQGSTPSQSQGQKGQPPR